MNPLLNKTTDGLKLGGSESLGQLDDLGSRLDIMARNAREGVQFIGDLVPPLKMVGGLTLGLGGAATAIHVIKNNLTEFANASYHIDTIAKNVSMTTDAFQELSGAMIENGSTREAAESAIVDIFDKATDAAYGFNTAFLSVLNAKHIGVSKTKEGLADVGKLLVDINRVMQSMSPGEQALFIKKLGLSPELLSYLRNTTAEIQRLKDQAKRDGLIFSGEDIQHGNAFKEQLNQISAAYDGMLMKGQAWLGQSETLMASVDQLKQIATYGLDSATVGSILTFNHGGSQADLLRQASGDEKFKDTLSRKEKLDLTIGYASEDLIKKLDAYYKPVWAAERLNNDLERAKVSAPVNVANPLDQALGNTPEQVRLSQLEEQNNLPQGLLDKVWSTESGRGKKMLSPKGAEGHFQFMPPTGRAYGLKTREDRMDFNKSSEAAARYLADLLKMFDGDVKKAVAAYNWGPKRVKKLGLGHAPAETRNYLQQIMPGLPLYQPQGEGNTGDNGSQDIGYRSPEDSLFSHGQNINVGDGEIQYQRLASAIANAMQDNKTQIELTLIDSKTGERKTIVGNGKELLEIRTRVSTTLTAKERHRQRMNGPTYEWKKPQPNR
ncbi:lytic transglycosylase domain-containing protein [Serratia oryzae]|uniref:lytic transglycosylase domain-containing protein n=1 Tax=Serratia oryzae TaxID=2034155 RepID=UPI0012E1C6B6|nr:lytic transglycosylase domain-containing protein [Serratia oryzae]